MRKLSLLAILLLLAACAHPHPGPPAGEAIIARTAAADWSAQGTWRLRTSALFELRGARMPMSGFLHLDVLMDEARLIGLNDLGLKMFDLSVTTEGEELHFLLPELAKFPRLGEAVALSVRRIFLSPRPAVGDGLSMQGEELRLVRRENGSTLHFRIGAEDAILLEKGATGPAGQWRVIYHNYRAVAGTAVPGRLVLDDFRGGYRLTLWLDEARRSDE